MRCPIDGTELAITDRGGVEIDYCPRCRGVWLDRGELDKIIDRTYATPDAGFAPSRGSEGTPEAPAMGVWANEAAPPNYPPQPNPAAQNHPAQNQHGQNQPGQPGIPGLPNAAQAIVPALGGLIAGMAASKMSGQGRGYAHGHKKRKHKGWLDEMFDFDD